MRIKLYLPQKESQLFTKDLHNHSDTTLLKPRRHQRGSRHITVNTAARLRLAQPRSRGLIPDQGTGVSFTSPDRFWGKTSLLYNGHRDFSGVKQLVREVDHSPHLVLRVRMSGAVPLLPHMP